jgi:type IX secretion system PorP/SprF family membrane protein
MEHNIRFYLFLGILAMAGAPLWGQQPAQYSMYMLNKYNYNTAYAGLDGSLSATGVFRKQWVSFAGSPLTFQANVHLPIPYLRSGVGVGLEHDRIGAEVQTRVRASYNYIFSLGGGQLSVGVAGNYLQKTLDGSLLRTPEGNYEGGTNNHNDALLGNERAIGATFTAEAGVYYKHKRFELGVSAINIQEPVASLTTGAFVQEIRYRRAMFVQAQYDFQITDDIILQPSTLIKIDFTKVQAELAVLLKYKNQFFGGLGYRGYDGRSQDALFLLAGMQINKNMLLAYSYDISLGALRTYNSGSHEVVFNYNLQKLLGKEIPQKIIYNPRFL